MRIFEDASLRPVTVCGHRLTRSAHICAFFDSAKQRAECVAPYLAEGLANGELVYCIEEADRCATRIAQIENAMDVPLAPFTKTRQFRLLTPEASYLEEPGFEADRMIEALKKVLREAAQGAYPRVRTCGDMGWALRALESTDALMDYEARVNHLTEMNECTFMCAYDINLFSGRTVVDVLSTHPMVVMGDRIYENPYYVEPGDFIHSLRRRGSAVLHRSDH